MGRWRAGIAVTCVAGGLLLAGCGSDDPPVVSTPTEAATGAGGLRVLLDGQRLTVLDQPLRYPSKGKAQVSSSIITIEPGQDTGWIKNPAPTYVYVLDGALTVEYDGGVVREFRAGEALLEAVGTWHNGTNTGTVTARILLVHLGAKGLKNTVKRP